MRRLALLPLALAGCLPANEGYLPPNTAPLTLPLVDGRPLTVRRDAFGYTVSRTQTSHGFEFRVTRQGRDFDYSEGLIAKKAAEAFCAGYNRSFSASAMGRFSLPNAWVFDGDCA